MVLLACSVAVQAQSQEPAQSPREFVEEFYNWYVPKALSQNPVDLALKLKSPRFSTQLAQLLKEDSAAQAKCAEIVGIDFDPFLSGQDPADHYEVGDIAHEGQTYRADIYRLESGKRTDKPDVRAEFVQSQGHWVFVNFLYPSDGSDLLKILRLPRPKCTNPLPAKKK